jgi:hypothetical protein
MPLTTENKYYDFEELFFEKDCNIDNIIINFFVKYKDISKGDTEYITYKIKKIIMNDRNLLMEINGDGKDYYKRIGKNSFIKHYVIPEQNDDKEYYIYSINSFI